MDIQLNKVELDVVKKLVKEYGSAITLGDLLSKAESTEKVPISECVIHTHYTYTNANELTGESRDKEGTIAYILDALFSIYPAKNDKDAVTLEETEGIEFVEELAGRLLEGETSEFCRDVTITHITRELLEEELIEYLRSLKVDVGRSDFNLDPQW